MSNKDEVRLPPIEPIPFQPSWTSILTAIQHSKRICESASQRLGPDDFKDLDKILAAIHEARAEEPPV